MKTKFATGRFADIANRLRAVRHCCDLSSKSFALQAQIDPKSYSQWESGSFRVSLDGASRLRERYGISLDFIYFGSMDTLPNKIAVDLSSSPFIKANMKSTVNPD